MKELKIKEWIYNKECQSAIRFNKFIDVTESSRDENGKISADNSGYITVVAEILGETEKALHVMLSTGDIDGDVNGWSTWIPKSQIA